MLALGVLRDTNKSIARRGAFVARKYVIMAAVTTSLWLTVLYQPSYQPNSPHIFRDKQHKCCLYSHITQPSPNLYAIDRIARLCFIHCYLLEMYVCVCLTPSLNSCPVAKGPVPLSEWDRATHYPIWPHTRCSEGDRMISRGQWPPRSPDLNTCQFYLCAGLLQSSCSCSVTIRHWGRYDNKICSVCCTCIEFDRHIVHLLWTTCLLEVTCVWGP